MASQLITVGKGDLKLGEPLPYSVYDKGGTLLLKKGFTINLERHFDILIQNGAYLDEGEVASARAASPAGEPLRASSVSLAPRRQDEQNSFEMLDLVKVRLQRLFEHYKAGRMHDEFIGKIEEIGITVLEACTHDTDSVLACLHLDYDIPYEVVHHLQAAVLCELIGKKLGVKDDARLTLIKAALTHDIGLIDLQDTLDRQVAPLTADQKARIESHPRDSAEVLQRLGVTDPGWLGPVRHHHERIDGSGYPDHLTGDAIKIPVRVLALADIYSAMIRDRPYRKAMVSKGAMRELMLEQGSKTDQRLIQVMIKELGVFPPGAIVRLVNKEIAVVKERQENSAYPIVYSFVKADGMPMLTPIRRETVKADFNVDGIVPFSQYRGCISLIRSLWSGD
jgi:HD-GYP domain-containing protein (c-di-GMP phosphodiesterase class II)